MLKIIFSILSTMALTTTYSIAANIYPLEIVVEGKIKLPISIN